MAEAKGKKESLKQMTVVALVAAVLCVLGPFTIPLHPVPISLANFGIMLGVQILGMRKGTFACLIYILIGMVGLPVFSGFGSGFSKLFGPTGGYIIGYIFLAVIGGLFVGKFKGKFSFSLIGNVLGTAVLYAFGTVWLAYQAGMSFSAALTAGVIPFIIGDGIKIVLAVSAGIQIRKALVKSGLLSAL